MRLAIVGSRGIDEVDLDQYIDGQITEIISGGANGVDRVAAIYAQEHHIPLKIFLPQYDRYGRAAPLRRNDRIVEYADEVLAIWDGVSSGTKYVVEHCRKNGVPCRVIVV